MPDGVLSGFAIETPLSVDVNVEFESNIAIQACKIHAIRYCSSPDFSAFDRHEPFVDFVEFDAVLKDDESERWDFERFNVTLIDEDFGQTRELLSFYVSIKIMKTEGYFYKELNYSILRY